MYSQRVLQIEKTNSLRTRKIFPGTTLTFHIRGAQASEWRTETIEEIIPERGVFITEIGEVKVADIETFRYRRAWPKYLSASFYSFGTSFFVYSGVATLFKLQPYDKQLFIVPAIAYSVGFILSKSFKYRKEHFGKNKRLRLLDLDFTPRN